MYFQIQADWFEFEFAMSINRFYGCQTHLKCWDGGYGNTLDGRKNHI